ncbi:MAG: phosphoglucosamine mutase [Clostridia bacterium]|nr:phosphoglucosamine mutase [Clostridia bacterium]
MTLGEKITALRIRENLSQEELADKLFVSRQAISRWETNQTLPQIDKIIQLCNFFKISTDELLIDKKEITSTTLKKKNRYFGTDGFRGEANVNLLSIQAYKIGRFLGWYFSKETLPNRPKIVVGKDTRRSSYMLEYAIVAGLTASGADAYMLHVTTTPSVSYVTRLDGFDCGIMITASHNPYYDNGIKVINRYGEKLNDDVTSLIEDYIDGNLENLGVSSADLPLAHGDKIGLITDYASGRNRYVGYLISLASHSYRNLKIGLDCANGSSYMIAKSVFSALGAQVEVVGAEPNGLNINKNCGSTHIENLCKLVKEKHLDLGFAFDGDADRCIAVDENGCVVDGDSTLYILAKRLKARGMLNGNTVVTTIMSNSGFIRSLEEIGIKTIQTQVGDRFVYECMQSNDYGLGGEQSGHIIIKKYSTTGDGILTAIMIMEEVLDTKYTLAQLRSPIKLYPQYLINVKVKDKKETINGESVILAKKRVEDIINKKGRVLLRESGTEPVVRIMVESESLDLSIKCASDIKDAIMQGGYTVE